MEYAQQNPSKVKKAMKPNNHIQNLLLQFDDYNYAVINSELEKGIARKFSSVKMDNTFSFNKLQSFRE